MRAAQYAVRRIHGLSRTVVSRQWRCWAGTDLITGHYRFIESYAPSPFKHRPHSSPLLSPSTMSSTDALTASLATLSIKPAASVVHADTNSPASWRDALLATPSVPDSFELIKTLVYKPKTAKTATPVPVVVIARDETETSSSALGKKLNLKELRLASEDLLAEFFGLDKNSRAFFMLVWFSLSLLLMPHRSPSVTLGAQQGYVFKGRHGDRRLHRIFVCHVCSSRVLVELDLVPFRKRHRHIPQEPRNRRCQDRRNRLCRAQDRRASCQARREGERGCQDRWCSADRDRCQEGGRFFSLVPERACAAVNET